MAKSFELKAVIMAVDKMSPSLRNINRTVRSAKFSLRRLGDESRKLTGTFASLVAPIGAVAGALGVGGLAGSAGFIVRTSAEFERFQTILETIEGSSEKARNSMRWVADFARKTPYQLNEVTDAYVRLSSYGIDPQSGALESAGDAAAAMGKSLEQAVEALADAMTGENERLKEFGIKASKQGDKIVYTWTENGKQMAASANANSRAQIQAVIQGIWNRRYAGAMDKLSRTWDGMWSNLQDTIAQFALSIGEAGLFPFLKGEIQSVLERFNRMAADGTLKTWAKNISDSMVTAFKEIKRWVMAVNWSAVWADIKTVAGWVSSLVGALGGIKGVAIILGVLVAAQIIAPLIAIGTTIAGLLPLFAKLFARMGGVAAASSFFSGAIKTASAIFVGSIKASGVAITWLWRLISFTPWGRIVTVLSVIGALVYKNWDAIVSTVRKAWARIKAVFEVNWFSGLLQIWLEAWQAYANAILQLVKSIIPNSLMPERLKNMKFSFANDAAAYFLSQRTDATQKKPLSAPAQRVTGEMTMRFENAPAGMRVSSVKTNDRGFFLNPDVGYGSTALGLP